MNTPAPRFDQRVEQAALEFFGDADAEAIARCRGVTYDEALHQIQRAHQKASRDADQGKPITIDGRNGVLMWFVTSVQDGTLHSTSTPPLQKSKSWWRRLFGT